MLGLFFFYTRSLLHLRRERDLQEQRDLLAFAWPHTKDLERELTKSTPSIYREHILHSCWRERSQRAHITRLLAVGECSRKTKTRVFTTLWPFPCMCGRIRKTWRERSQRANLLSIENTFCTPVGKLRERADE